MSAKVSAHGKLLRIQKKIFASLKSEVEYLLGKTPASIRSYERQYQSDFKQVSISKKPISKEQLIQAIRKAEVTFIADFHTFPQAQRTALRLIREAVQPGETWYIGLELIPSQFQRILDDYQQGNISLQQFHDSIHYNQEWGFPWANYAPIFAWARENQIRLIALNRPKALNHWGGKPFQDAKDEVELHDRDQWAAGIITDVMAENQRAGRAKMIVLYGELHVGSKHLPRQLEKISGSYLKEPLRTLTVHQNHDPLFWKLAARGAELQKEIIQLKKKNAFCVFSGTPWNKLQSLVSWAEGGGHEEDFPAEPDYLSWVQADGKALAELLAVESPSFESLSVRTVDDADFLGSLRKNHGLSAQEFSLVRFHVLSNLRIYIPRAQIAYLATPSQNSAAELAAVQLLRDRTRVKTLFEPGFEDHLRRVMEACFGFFGSLVLNPKRKCDLPRDHAVRLKALKKGARPSFRHEREARQLTLRFLHKPKSLGTSHPSAALMAAATFTGYILGKRLHSAFLAEKLTVETIRSLFLVRPSGEDFHERKFSELLRVIQGSEIEASKTQHL